jgi:D-cysteine desulfhydrase family pyridoxal phosphate-dependent enzyme
VMVAFDKLPRIKLGHLPTPLERLDRLGRALGLRTLLVKRDDCTGLGGGGNKIRKLEFLLGAAIDAGAVAVVTGGALQSNHARQTAAAAARLGLSCHLVLTVSANYARNGNRLLDDLFGAQVSVVPSDTDLSAAIAAHADTLSARGHKAFPIPVGGSNGSGALGYVAAGWEIAEDLRKTRSVVSRIVLATGSGGTQAGLLLGLALAGVDIVVDGVSVGATEDRQKKKIVDCLAEVEALLGCRAVVPQGAIRVHSGYVGAAYGEPTPAMISAVGLAASTEGLLLDPVYTGKAMAGLADLTRRGEIPAGEPVLFLHTGGAVALFAYDAAFHQRRRA